MKRITSIKTYAARAAVTLLLAVLTVSTVWAQSSLPEPDGEGNVTITADGIYNASGNFNNIILADGVGIQDAVTLNVGTLTINGTIQGSPIIWNVSEGSSLTFTGNEPIHVDEFNMTGGQVHVNNMEIMGECTISGGTINGTGDMRAQSLTIHHGTISGGSFNTTEFTVSNVTISGGTINTSTFRVEGGVTIDAANSSLSITANFFQFYEGFGSITITSGSLTDGTNEYSGTITEISTSGETTLTPVNTITVTLDAQGGSGGTTSVEATPNIAMPSITPPSRTSYIFGGYFTGTNGGGTQYYYADGTSAKDCDLNTATTLYAQWTESTTCTVTLDHQNGTATTSVTATNGEVMPSVTPPTRTGYTFGGYFTETNGGGTQYYYADGTSANNCDFTQATTLYAKWTAHTYCINFYGNGSTSGGMVSQYYTYDAEPQALSANQYVRAFTVTYNYNGATGGNSDASTTATATFNGWATSADGEKVYDDMQSVSNLTSGYLIALYAKWTDASITLPTPTKTGFAFDGWYSDEECTSLVGSAGSSYTPGSDVTLYARWKKLVTATGITVDNKTYDGTATATLNAANATVNGKVGEDNVTVNIDNATAVFADANAGTDKDVTITGVTLGGDKAGNYTLGSLPTDITGNITPKALTVTAKPKTITYGDEPTNDGVTYNGFVNSEDESDLGGTLSYTYKTNHDGTGDDYTASSPIGTYYITPGGLTSSNYDITFASGTLEVTARVTPYGCLTYTETGNATTTTIELDGNSTADLALTASVTGQTTLTRSFTAGQKATICLPFAVTADQKNALGTFYQFDGLKEGTDNVVKMQALDDSAPLEAHKAYILAPKADFAAPIDFGQQTIEASPSVVASTSGDSDEFTFQGTYSLITWDESHADLGKVYCFVGLATDGYQLGEFAKVGRNTTCKPFRAYLKYTGMGDLADAQSAARRTNGKGGLPDTIAIEWVSATGTTTGVSTVRVERIGGDWYSLDGRKLNGEPTKKGMYINNGKKIVVR